MAFAVPLLDGTRAKRELDWEPTRTGTEALSELIDAMRHGVDYATPPLARGTSGPLRIRELLTSIGGRPSAPAHYGWSKILIAPSCFFWKIS